MAVPTGIDLPQLTLALFDNAELRLSEYIPGPNEFAFEAVSRWCCGEGPNFLMLWGAIGTGKSHLLQSAVCSISPRQTDRTMYVPLASFAELGAGLLEDLEVIEYLAIDDIHLIAGEASWERALFALFNRMQSAGHRLLLSSRAGPRQPFKLADLNSRLSSGLSYQLKELSDGDKQLLLQQRARSRGLSMSDKVSQYLVSRLRRDMTELNRVFERIDTASLSAGRELTIPFVREVLGLD